MGGGSGNPLDTAAGIAISGGYIYNALAAGNLDAVETELGTLDVCISHPSPFGEFHYHYWGPCLKEGKGWASKTEAPTACRTTEDCLSAPLNFITTTAASGQEPAYTADNWDDVIGLARDGHMIIGPHKSDGSTWGCDRDVCNGNFIDG